MTFNFQPRFAAAIESGQKRSTIRKPRRDGKVPRPGDTLHFFTGMRTKACYRLGEAKCKSVSRIGITSVSFVVNGERCPAYLCDWLAQRDGFTRFADMVEWFRTTHGLPFTGNLIEW
jgi:hypothetical protein